MQLVYFPQDDRFFARLTEEAVSRMPEGAFSTGLNVPVYAMRVDGEGAGAATFFLVPGTDGHFFWVPLDGVRLARR
jgi:hypothetical protein